MALRSALFKVGGQFGVSPQNDSDIYYWGETDTLGLADNAAALTVPDKSPLGTSFVRSAAGPVYKTNQLNGYGIVRCSGPVGYELANAGIIDDNTVILLIKGISGSDTNDIWNQSAVATRLRKNNTDGMDFYANSGSAAVTVLASTGFTSWNTVVLQFAPAVSANLKIRVNGTQVASFIPHTNNNGSGIMRLWQSINGDFAAVGRWYTDIGLSRIQSAEEYLRRKYRHY